MNPAHRVGHALPLFLPCGGGVEPLLAQELLRLLPAGTPVRAERGGVAVDVHSLAQAMALNLESRLASRVLLRVAHGPYRNEADLYGLARTVDWAQWITPKHTIRVDTTAHRSPLQSLNFAGLRIKDAVCDQLRERFGSRPDVDTRYPDLSLVLHLHEMQAELYVDTSGEALFKRGWREDKGEAPLKETLAAAMLAAAGWQGTPQAGGALHDPCCGSGTIAIEAAQIACDMAPGLQRRFAFERLLPFCTVELRAQWQQLRQQARERVRASAVPIVASDIAFRMVDFARRNAQRAGVAHCIEFHGGDALERPAPAIAADMPGTLMLNPPYGERIDVGGKARMREGEDLPVDFFARLGLHWKHTYGLHSAGWTAHVLCPDPKLPGLLRMKESRRTPLWNGGIECRLFRFELRPKVSTPAAV